MFVLFFYTRKAWRHVKLYRNSSQRLTRRSVCWPSIYARTPASSLWRTSLAPSRPSVASFSRPSRLTNDYLFVFISDSKVIFLYVEDHLVPCVNLCCQKSSVYPAFVVLSSLFTMLVCTGEKHLMFLCITTLTKSF